MQYTSPFIFLFYIPTYWIMSSFYTPVRDLKKGVTSWVVRLRLVRCYEVPEFKKSDQVASIECVFHDKQGDRIHASIRKNAMQNLQRPTEGEIYVLKDFIVAENRQKMSTTDNKHIIIFFRQTKISRVSDADFPAAIYLFKPFNQFGAGKQISQRHLFDIIGRIVSCKLPHVQTENGQRMEFKLEDLDRTLMTCTLWDKYVDDLLPFVQAQNDKNIVVIIQFSRVSLYEDEVRFSNAYNVTKIIVNGDAPEFTDFNHKLLESGVGHNEITTVPSKTKVSISDDFTNGTAVLKNLAEICENSQEGLFWVAATIVDVETYNSWCYLACRKCSKKLLNDGDFFLCVKCATKVRDGQYKYKLDVMVIDESGNALFTLWDRECNDLVGQTANQIMKEFNGNTDEIPLQVMEALTDRIGLFKIQVKPTNQSYYQSSYSVLKMTTDSTILSLYNETHDQKKEAAPTINNIEVGKKDTESSNNIHDVAIVDNNQIVADHSKTDLFEETEDDVGDSNSLMDEFTTTLGSKRKRRIFKKSK